MTILALPFGPSTWLQQLISCIRASHGLSDSSGFQRGYGIDKQENQTWAAVVLALSDFKELTRYRSSNIIMCMCMGGICMCIYMYASTCLPVCVNSLVYINIIYLYPKHIYSEYIYIHIYLHMHTYPYVCTHSICKHRLCIILTDFQLT